MRVFITHPDKLLSDPIAVASKAKEVLSAPDSHWVTITYVDEQDPLIQFFDSQKKAEAGRLEDVTHSGTLNDSGDIVPTP